MDMLKKELLRKKRALQAASEQSWNDDKNNTHETATGDGKRQRRYVKAAVLRRLQDEKEGELRQQERKQLPHSEEKRAEIAGGSISTLSAFDGNTTDEPNISKQYAIKDDNTRSDESDSNVLSLRFDKAHESHQNDLALSSSYTSSIVSFDNLDTQQLTDRLRSLGLPVRLFGEQTKLLEVTGNEKDSSQAFKRYDDSQRLKRLNRALTNNRNARNVISDMEDFQLSSGHGIRNSFLEKVDEDDSKKQQHLATFYSKQNKTTAESSLSANQTTGAQSTASSQQTTADAVQPGNTKSSNIKSSETLQNDPHRRIYVYFRGLLKEWEMDLLQRSDDIKRSMAGRTETKTHKQCKDYIRPLFKLCKTRQLEQNLCDQIVKIVDNCEIGEFVKAHDAYMDVAIGRAAWPIGVTMVGIHARTGRAKIESQNVAHVMNSELQRKYLTSVKRLMSYAQKKATHVDPSKKVLS